MSLFSNRQSTRTEISLLKADFLWIHLYTVIAIYPLLNKNGSFITSLKWICANQLELLGEQDSIEPHCLTKAQKQEIVARASHDFIFTNLPLCAEGGVNYQQAVPNWQLKCTNKLCQTTNRLIIWPTILARCSKMNIFHVRQANTMMKSSKSILTWQTQLLDKNNHIIWDGYKSYFDCTFLKSRLQRHKNCFQRSNCQGLSISINQ